MALKTSFSTTKFFEVLLIGFIAVQVITWLLATYTDIDIQIVKGGWVILLMLVVVGIVTLYSTGKKLTQLRKEDLIFIFIEFAAIILAFIYLPQIIPQIFSSYSLQVAEVIKTSINSIIEITGTSLVG